MNFLIPCDDIISDISQKYEALSINKDLVIIGYQETQWVNNTPIKQSKFPEFESLLSKDDNISVDNIVFIKYIDIFLWHKTNKIDRFEGSGNTQKSEKWDKIKNKYLGHIKQKNIINDDDEKKERPKCNKITLNVNTSPQPLHGQQQRRRSYYYWDNTASNIISNGFYEITDKNNNDKTKINVEKTLKKSYKKTKIYYEHSVFKYLTTKQLDSIYRNYENMEINIMNETTLNMIYRLNENKGKIKKICVLNVYGSDNGFNRNTTLSHSLNKYNNYYSKSTNKSDEASKYLYTNTMIYSPNCIVFNDVNGNLTANNFKVSFLTAYPVNCSEYFRMKRKIFNEPMIENKLKILDDKLLNNNNNKFKMKMKNQNNKNNNKSAKKTREETEEYIAKLNEMKKVIDGIMEDRIRRMIEIAIYNGCDAIIFDAFGCDNNYGNDVQKIANIFAGFMQSVYYNCFKSVTFTILDHNVNNRRNRNNRQQNKRKDVKSMMSTFRIFQDTFQDKFE